jgi:tRNA pseudouridine38-40 synthase
MRYFFEISYDGRNYHGWQSQQNAIGIQDIVEDSLSKLFGFSVKIVGSGRTDTGVHCIQQFFHADLPVPFDRDRLLARLNSFLPRDIAIRSIRPVKPEANARRDAVLRTYEYRLTLIKDPLLLGLALHYHKSLDFTTMNRAAALLEGEHDFRCFSKVKTDVNHFICTVKIARWKKGSEQAIFTVSANRFLRGMVRAMVGTLLDVGTHETGLSDFKAILRSGDRRKAGANVAPFGLYLKTVEYPRTLFIR